MRTTYTLITVLLLAPLTSLQASQPVVFWVSDPIEPGQTALLFGDGIGADVVAAGERVPDATGRWPAGERAGRQGGGRETGSAPSFRSLRESGSAGQVGAGALRPALEKQHGESLPILLNRTEAWWWRGGSRDVAAGVTSEVAVPGEELRVFGKNLGDKTAAWLAGPGGTVALETVKAEKYAVTFRLPASLAAGDYPLWVHNGFGGALGFAEPLKVKVGAANPWPATVFNVRDFGARGCGCYAARASRMTRRRLRRRWRKRRPTAAAWCLCRAAPTRSPANWSFRPKRFCGGRRAMGFGCKFPKIGRSLTRCWPVRAILPLRICPLLRGRRDTWFFARTPRAGWNPSNTAAMFICGG